MAEQVKKRLTKAEVYGESVLEQMRKKPESCDVYNALVPHIGNNPFVAFAGVGGGGADVAMNYLKKLRDIHKPHCKLQSQHRIFT